MTVAEQRRPPGPKTVRAWFDYTINPLLRALDFEIGHVETGRLGWKSSRSRLDNVARIDQYLEFDTRDNFYQLCEYFQPVADITREHDQAVDNLLEGCRHTHRQLEERWVSWAQPVWKNVALSELRAGAVEMTPERKTLLVEFVINRTGQLDESVGLQPIWNAGREQFLAAASKALQQTKVSGPLHGLLLDGVAESSGKLLASATKLRKELHDLRRQLAADYDEPYATKG